MSHIFNAVMYLKQKSPQLITFDDIVSYLSLPANADSIAAIRRSLKEHDRVEFEFRTETGKESFRYRSTYRIANVKELMSYLSDQKTLKGINVKELKDGWPDCVPVINRLEKEGHLLVIRNEADGSPRTVWYDSPDYHIANPQASGSNREAGKVDPAFVEAWHNITLPSNEDEVYEELENAGLSPTRAPKEVRDAENGVKTRKKSIRSGGKMTNSHMLGTLKDS